MSALPWDVHSAVQPTRALLWLLLAIAPPTDEPSQSILSVWRAFKDSTNKVRQVTSHHEINGNKVRYIFKLYRFWFFKFTILNCFCYIRQQVSLGCVLAVFAVMTLTYPTYDGEHSERTNYRLDSNVTVDDGWYAPVAMKFTPISKKTAESRRIAIRLKRPGYASPPYWRNVNPWSLSSDAGYHGDSSNDSQLSRLIDSIMQTGAVYLPKKSVSNLETNSHLIAPIGEMETLFVPKLILFTF